MRYNKPNKLEITKALNLLRLLNKTSTSFLFLEFRYFELRNIYKRIPSPIAIMNGQIVYVFTDAC